MITLCPATLYSPPANHNSPVSHHPTHHLTSGRWFCTPPQIPCRLRTGNTLCYYSMPVPIFDGSLPFSSTFGIPVTAAFATRFLLVGNSALPGGGYLYGYTTFYCAYWTGIPLPDCRFATHARLPAHTCPYLDGPPARRFAVELILIPMVVINALAVLHL